jgi:gliding motility-associated-like protein
MYKSIATLVLFLSCFELPSFAQKEAQTWYFGRNAGLDFSTTPPTPLTNGQINTREGVSSISDPITGQLLFYSEGTTVWNRNHGIMPNGAGLLGDYSSTQSSVIVPNPGNPNQYYLFTTALLQGVRYSVIDMQLQGGLGDVIAANKNTLLIPNSSSSEKLIAVRHCNKKDYWVVTHTINSNTFYVYLVNAAGVQAPLTYNLGYSIAGSANWEATGYLKFSPDGSKLAHVIGPASSGALSQVELLSFNNKTGVLSGPVNTLNNLNSPYGVEFSQSNNRLYVTELIGKKILQYDLTATNINASQYIVASSTNLNFGALQWGPDNKIYVSAENGYDIGYGYLGVINNPELNGAACGYLQDAIFLNGKTALIGLPTFNATFLQKDTASVKFNGNCTGNSIPFSLTNTTNTDSVKWKFGDASDSSMLLAPAHTYSAPGTYPLQVIIYRSCNTNDTINKSVNIVNCSLSQAVASFTTPDTVCITNPVAITNTSSGASSYYWNFCVADITSTPVGTNLGNISGNLTWPVFMDYVFVNNNYYGFLVNHMPGGLVRLDFGNSLLNTPTSVNLGNFGGIIPSGNGAEGIRVVQNAGKWYAIIVGGHTPSGYNPRILKVDFGANITNPTPIATDWGNIGNMAQPVDFDIFQEGGNWYGFTVNAENNTFTRFSFTNSFDNTPTAVNLGNIGMLAYPTGIYTINDNGNYKVFITNEGNGASLTRLDFGSSLLNNPTAVNLGNPGNMMTSPRDLTIMRSCGQIVAFVANGRPGYGNIVRLDFNNDLNSIPVPASLGNIGNLDFAHSISRLFRVNEDIYGFVTNVSNNTITRLRFPGCTNASIPNSTAQNPPPVTYNAPGTYNINLTVDDGQPTQSAFCKQVVVMPAPVATVQSLTLCKGQQIKIGTGTKHATYLWNTGATTDSISITSIGTYWVEVSSFGCKATDTFKVTARLVSDFGFQQDVCNPYSVQFFNAGTGTAAPWWDMGDGQIITGSTNLQHQYQALGNYTVRFSVADGICVDTVSKVIAIHVIKEDIILTPDTVICEGATKQLRAKPALSYCWFPTTYLDNPAAQNPMTSTPQDITYYLNTKITGNNLITNGNFSGGNTGFGSDYAYTTANTTVVGVYAINSNPNAWNSWAAKCTDHTGANGNMMLVDGANIAGQKVWYSTIAITPNTSYAFSCWIQSIFPTNPARLQFFINGKLIGNIFNASSTTCQWQQFYETWNAGNSTTAEIAIVNQNTNIIGNDFALDDLSFAPVFIKQDSIVVKVEKPIVRTNKDTTICKEKPVYLATTGAATYSWSPVTGLSNPAIANPVAVPAATTQYIVTGTTVHGCIAKDTVVIATFPKPVITKTADTLVCRNTIFPLFITGGVSYVWSPAGQVSNVNSDHPLVTVGTEAITYQVAITDSYSCINLDSVRVAVRPYPLFKATGNRAICEGGSQPLQASGGDFYQWSPATLVNDPSSPAPVATPATTTLFSVYIKDATCAFDTTISMKVTVNPNPVLTVEKANDVNCNKPTTQLTVTGALRYTWSPATGLDDPTKANPVAAIDTTTQYAVSGTNQFGCTSTAFVAVMVTRDGIPRFITPNAFTPNGDGNNDCFGIKRWGNAKVQLFSVYNRWGQAVFQTNNPATCWDGTFNGKPQDAGAYVFVIKAITLCGEVTRKGTVMLIR